jgi:hypothetical protein
MRLSMDSSGRFLRVTLQDMFDKTFSDIAIHGRSRARIAVAQHHVIHHRERSHQFGSRPLCQQWPAWIRYLHHQRLSWLPLLGEPAHMFSQQRIEVTG